MEKHPEFSQTQNMSYEQAFHELANIVETLENEEHSLEKSLYLFERGQSLAKYCTNLLDKAEIRLQQIPVDEFINL